MGPTRRGAVGHELADIGLIATDMACHGEAERQGPEPDPPPQNLLPPLQEVLMDFSDADAG